MNAVSKILRGIAYELAIKGVLKRLVAFLPILGIPGINFLAARALSKLGILFYEELGEFVVFKFIDSKVGEEKDNFDEKKSNLESVIEKGTEDEINKATEEFKEAVSKLINTKPSSK